MTTHLPTPIWQGRSQFTGGLNMRAICFVWLLPIIEKVGDLKTFWSIQRIELLSSSDPHPDTLFCLFWHGFWHSIWECLEVYWHTLTFCPTFFLAYTLTFYLAVLRHSFLHSLWHVFGSRRGPLHPELVIWLTTIETHSHDELQEEHTRSKGEVGGVGGRRRREK